MLKSIKKEIFLAYQATIGCLPPHAVIALKFRLCMGAWPNLREPQTFNEKIQYRKLHGDHVTYARLADKILVKTYVRQILGEDFVIPTLWEGRCCHPWKNATGLHLSSLKPIMAQA